MSINKNMFRIWDLKNKQMLTPEKEGYNYAIALNGFICCGYIEGDMLIAGKQDQFVVQKFIGLFDINGTPIFEGDILEIENENRVIQWGEETLSWCYRGSCEEHPIYLYKSFFGAVVGNRFENPELV